LIFTEKQLGDANTLQDDSVQKHLTVVLVFGLPIREREMEIYVHELFSAD
jgi:hypothetical protein